MRWFLFSLIILSLILLAGLHLAVSFEWIVEVPSFGYPTLFFLAFSTTLIIKYLYRQKDSTMFVQLFLLLMVVKLVAFFAYLIAIAILAQETLIENAVFFLICYLFYTVLEIGFLYRQVNEKR